MASINTWIEPSYRGLGEQKADISMLEHFLDRTVVEAEDRTRFLDWLSWCLQNESDKPGWAPLLYSHEKGTGKSTLTKLMEQLFGQENTMQSNGVSQVTGRFNKPMLDKKLLLLEELKIDPASSQGNALKNLITEDTTAAERKGIDIETASQCCCFVFTTNHLPQFIEGNDRRFLVIDMGHDGHASGPKAKEFGEFMVEFYAWMYQPRNIASLYNSLMQRKHSEGFNPKSLNISEINTPVMQQVRSTSKEAVLQQLEELLEEDGRGAIPQSGLFLMFQQDLKANSSRMRHLMPALGWRQEQIKWGGKDYGRAIWVKPGYGVSRGKVISPDGSSCGIDSQAGFSGFELGEAA